MTKVQKEVVRIVSSTWAKLHDIAYAAGCSERTLAYWIDGKRVPRDLETVENVLNALGYELVIRGKVKTDCPWK